MVNKFAFRAAVYLVLKDKSKILLSRRYNTGYWDGSYSMVAGHVDGGETITRAMVREACEESGVILEDEDLKVVHVMHRICPDNVEYIDFYLLAMNWKGSITIKEPDKCDDLRWFEIDTLPENTIPYIQQALKHIQTGVTFSDWDARNEK